MNSKITIQKMFVSWQFPTWELPVSPKGTTSSPQGNYQFPAWELLRTLCLLCLMVLAGAVEAQTYKYYAIHNKDKGYLKQYKGIVGNDGTFRFGNGYDDNGVTYWVYSSDGYLRNNMYYLNAVDSSLGATLYLSVTADTKWDLVDDGGKKRFQLQGTTKILGLDNTTPVLRDNAELSLKYTACEMTIGNETSWNGPHLASDNATTLTVGSPQLYTYLRAYYKQKVDYSFTNDNDDASKNKVSATGQERRVYAMLTAPASTDATRGDKWDFDTDAGVIYNNTTSNVTATATYLVTPIDPIALKIHQEKIGDTSYKGENKEFKLTVQPKAFTPAEGKNYLLFFVNDGNRRFPYDKAEYSGNSVLMSNGKKAQLADPATPNQEISWEIVPDAEGYYSFKNVSTGRYIFYDDKDYTISNYGVTKVGATELPDNDTRYKFRLYRSDHGTYNPSYHIIPYCYQFAVHTNSGMVQEIFCALNPNQSPQSTVNAVSLYKANGQDNTRYAFYAYESASKYCLKTDYSIGIPDAIKTGNTATITSTGNYNFTAQSYHWRNINGAPGNNNIELEIAGTGSRKDIVYTWEVTGDVANYLESTTFEQTNVDKSTFKINVLSLPEGAVTGTLKVTAKVTSPETLTAPIEITLNIDPPINNEEPTDFTEITSLSEITNPTGHYRLTADASGTPAVSEFKGFLDGGMHTVSGLSKSLFTTLSGSAVVRNLMLSVNTFSDSGPQGALAGQAIGSCRIYNVGVLAGSIGSTDGYCGGIVGFLGGSSRVINCFSYANITGGTYVGGIVGYNNYSTTSSDPKTMVMNCMFYGDITNGGNKAPIYNGKIITNRGDQNGVGNYNYFYGGASYVQDRDIQTYNCALMAETRFLQRFEFFRHLLNSHRELAAWWATGSTANKDQMMKWVLLPSQIGTSTPYPILKTPGYYPSVVNIDAENAPTTTERNKGGKLGTLSVTIRMGDGEQFTHPTDAAITKSSLTLNITDKDPEHFNFNYAKVQLPYYNDVGTKNYTGNRVVTGWKIVSITGGTKGSFSTGTDATVDGNGNITATPYNFADRNCTAKDLYSTSKRVFNQGAYWDVPEGVTAITIEPYWAKAAYLADANADVVYNQEMGTAYNVPNVGGGAIYTNGSSYNIAGDNQVVYTSVTSARDAIGTHSGHTVYDYAIVLVGNAHYIGISSNNSAYFYTLMSADFDGDNEPDYSYILRFNGRAETHPVRVDFLNIPGLGMAQKSDGGTGSYNFGIMQPIGWFESTNTSLFRMTQFEYDRSNRGAAPLILQGGVMEQWVSGQNNGANNQTTYFHVGGNAWFKEFHRGTHQDKTLQSKHPPISVTGGDFDEFYLTGLYRADVKSYDDNAECYINGGRFGVVAGTGMEGIGDKSKSTGNIVWQIQNADIKEFYGGGINAAAGHIVEGSITTTITGGKIDQFCGGPKFGDMNVGKTVVTTATGCEFGTFFGAGYGGNSYSRRAPTNQQPVTNIDWNSWVKTEYTLASATGFPGISTQFNYQFLPMSDNTSNVARLFVEHVTFSLATTHSVTSTLTDCTITGNFYGGGSLGKVAGPVTSTLTNCKVSHNVYGAGYSASLPTVEVDSIGFRVEPYYYTELGTYRTGVKGPTTTYEWKQGNAIGIDKNNYILYTTENLSKTNLGSVSGAVTLTITGSETRIGGSVYGGGEESAVNSNTTVSVAKGTIVGSVYGGGALANTGNTEVNLTGGVIEGDVYGGGMGREATGTEGEEGYVAAVEATVGTTLVNLNGTVTQVDNGNGGTTDQYLDDCVVKGKIFGCNNINGTPLGNATVHIYKTQGYEGHQRTAADKLDNIDNRQHSYELFAVYGGGNLAAYEPENPENCKATVIIDGCDLTSIQTVYGGGNAASTPATHVEVNGTYEIGEVFGGGNGLDALPDGKPNPGANVGYKNYTIYEENGDQWIAKDDPAYDTKEERTGSAIVYGTGEAKVDIFGGRVHRVFGGSNTKGNVRVTAVTMLEDEGACHFLVDEAYGGGKSAPMDGDAQLLMSCIPGLNAAYGGAEEANIEGDVVLNITNGNFDRVFGGNNVSGTIGGTITVNIEETGCKPVIIGQLYGGGNQAYYTAPFKTDPETGENLTEREHGPTLNVRSFTSIGEIYGGGYGKTAIVIGDTYVNINVCDGQDFLSDETKTAIITENTGIERTFSFSEYVRTDDGGFEYEDDGETKKTTGQTVKVFMPARKGLVGAINNVFGGGNAAKVQGDTYVNIGTEETTDFATGLDDAAPETGVVVKGADIRGNVYGGGNNAEVTGNTHVVIGREATETPATPPTPEP